MNSTKPFHLNPLKKKKSEKIKFGLCVFIIFLFTMTVFQISFNLAGDPILKYSNANEINEDNLQVAAGLELYQDPFKNNFDDLWSFFESKYKSELDGLIDIYYRYGNDIGVILSNDVYSLDNLLLYKSLLQDQTDYYETFDTYLKLQETSLWYQSSVDISQYGFVKSVDGTTGAIIDSNRYLIDNVMPILMLFENIGYQINSFTINSKYPKNSIEEMFNLIDSDQFWDDTYSGFYDHNSTTDKYAESNFYAILALLKIHKYYEELGLDSTIKNRAYELANKTMDKLLINLWDASNGGFEYYGINDWSYETGSDYKYLITNAMGIICLLEYWKETGMQYGSPYFQRALYLYDLLEALWDESGIDAYEFSRNGNWGLSGADPSINLEANSIMMVACLKLFESTANITYYTRAFELHETFETSFYDNSAKSYRTSIDSPVDNNKNFIANLKLAEAYNNAFNVYNNTILNSIYNVTDEIPSYIFDQDIMNITSRYSFVYSDKYYNTSTSSYQVFTKEYIINNASITYTLKDPADITISQETDPIASKSTTLLYNITDNLKIGQGYSIYIFANSSKFGTAITLKQFNVISGLINNSIQGLPLTLYQGPVLNITIPINNTRVNDVELTVSLEGPDIINRFQTVLFISNVLTNVTFNLTTILGANIGPHMLNFTFKHNNISYLEILKAIQIGYSFDYTNFMYESEIVNGESGFVSLTLINFLPNNTQNLNISFYEQQSLIFKQEVFLEKNEVKTVSYYLDFSEVESNSINVKMEISKAETIFFSRDFSIQIIQKYHIISANFPELIAQGESAYFILIIQNNQPFSESFSLYINGEKVSTNLNQLSPGLNILQTSIVVTFNPYDFQSKSYTFELRDSSGEIIVSYYYLVNLELSAFNLVIFYMLPIIIPVAIILFYKNKEIKHRLLKR